MSGGRASALLDGAALLALLLGAVGCAVGAALDRPAFFSAWLSACLFWLGVPLGAVTLVLVHDLTGGRWMAAARPALAAASATMPLATLAFLPMLAGLGQVYRWSGGQTPGLANAFYLNDGFFTLRYALDLVVWNALAAWALFAPRAGASGVPRGLSWISGIGLVLLAYTAAFAGIDWVMSLEPRFWSAVLPMIVSAGWFNTGLALAVLAVALQRPAAAPDSLADLASILLATSIFWAYIEFCQYLIIWEENLKSEIVWYLPRIAGPWLAVIYAFAATGFVIPFFVLIWRPAKRSRAVVAAMAALIVLSRILYAWWLVLPQQATPGFGWVDLAALLAPGGALLLIFRRRLRHGRLWPARRSLEASHGRA